MGSQWETVMHADIIGTSSNAYKIDNEDPQSNSCKYSLAQGIATTLLMSSIGGSQNNLFAEYYPIHLFQNGTSAIYVKFTIHCLA